MLRPAVALFLALAVLAPAASAQTLYLAATAHTGGFEGTIWRSDLEIKAVGSVNAVVRIEVLRRGQANPNPIHVDVTVPAGQARRLEDVLEQTFSLEGAAALRITALEGAIVVASRTFNDAEGGTYGQYVPVLGDRDAIGEGDQGHLIQLSQSALEGEGFRTNIGLVNTTALTVEVAIALYRASGQLLGTVVDTLEPFEVVQLDKIFERVTGSAVDDGYAVLSSDTAGARFLAYASVIDNLSGDAVFMPAQVAEETSTTDAVVADHLAADGFGGMTSHAFATARSRFPKIFYGHTSHGSQIVTGLQMLENESSVYSMPQFTEVSDDLGHNGDLSWVNVTRSALAQPNHGFSMVMWSWCGGVSDNTPAGIQAYLDAMDQLEKDFPGVVFVYMTGHLDGSGNGGTLRTNNELIRSYCRSNNKVLFDFADIESWNPDGTFFPDDDDWCNWCTSWCASHTCPPCGDCAHSQCFNCYRKGQAFWWMLAELAE